MENFTNQTIDTTMLPRFEEVELTALHPSYWKVTVIHLLVIFSILWIGLAILLTQSNDAEIEANTPLIIGAGAFLTIAISFFTRLAFKKKAFAFRDHDVLFKSGIIATSTIVIPYNRIQHVALHEGLVSRWFGLAKVQIFTAGGKESDIEIPGIEKIQAENIKQLLMGKIQKQL